MRALGINYYQFGSILKKSDQVAPYFLYDLDKIRIFIELSDKINRTPFLNYRHKFNKLNLSTKLKYLA